MNEATGEKAWALHNSIIENEKSRRVLLLENMKLINEMHNSQLYRAVLGDENAPWSAYLTQHEVFYTASKVYMMNKIYQKYVVELGLDLQSISDVPHSKLANIITLVDKTNVEEWLTKARVLTSQDFQDEIRKAQGKGSYLDCKHNFSQFEVCARCGFRHKNG